MALKLSKETREKMAAAARKRYEDPEERKRHSIACTGHKFSPEICAKLSAMRMGRKRNPISAAKQAIAIKKRWEDPVYREKMVLARIGKRHSDETKRKMSLAQCGEKSYLWQGGISFEPYCPKFNEDLKRRIRAFFDHHCMMCGKPTEENKAALSCHHVEYNKQACCDGKPVHFAALCGRCHWRTNNDRFRWEAIIHRIIDEIYGGRSYYTKEEWNRAVMQCKN
jgi:hypothetical protein